MFCVTSVRRPPAAASRLLEPRQREMRGVRLGVQEVAAARVVEGEHRLRVAREGLRGREFHRVELRPDPFARLVAKGSEPALGRDPAPVRTKMCWDMPPFLAPSGLDDNRTQTRTPPRQRKPAGSAANAKAKAWRFVTVPAPP